jgi:outer membrane lipoprotein-sorting protein
MKKTIVLMLIIISCLTLSAKKSKQETEVPDIEAQMEKADKIESYSAKKDVAWHKTEYNKVLKYLNKNKK